MARDRARLWRRSARRSRRPARQELDQRDLYPQHVRRLARLYGRRRAGTERSARYRDLRAGTICGDQAVMPAAKRADASEAPHPDAHAAPLTASECEEFLIHEARLLDEGRFDEWLD